MNRPVSHIKIHQYKVHPIIFKFSKTHKSHNFVYTFSKIRCDINCCDDMENGRIICKNSHNYH